VKRVLVTGGGTGIGREIAAHFVAAGARVAVCGRRENVIHEAAAALPAMGVVCDIRKPDDVALLVAAVRESFGGIDVLVNNAGGQFAAPAEAISPRGFEAVVRNNLLGTWHVTREVAVACMIPQAGGAIVNVIANIARGFPGMVHTGAARAGVENMTRTLAIEWMRHNIRVNAVAPGIIDTPALAQYPDGLVPEMRRHLPMGRLGTPAEVAAPVLFLASAAASYITGATLYVDGGASLWGENWPVEANVQR
jgi:citronellol/citronellal dehydrogenase